MLLKLHFHASFLLNIEQVIPFRAEVCQVLGTLSSVPNRFRLITVQHVHLDLAHANFLQPSTAVLQPLPLCLSCGIVFVCCLAPARVHYSLQTRLCS